MKIKTKIVIFLIIAGIVLSFVGAMFGGEIGFSIGFYCFGAAAIVFLVIVFEKLFLKKWNTKIYILFVI